MKSDSMRGKKCSKLRKYIALVLCLTIISGTLTGFESVNHKEKADGTKKSNVETADNNQPQSNLFTRGWDSAAKYTGTQIAADIGSDYIDDVSDSISKLEESINAKMGYKSGVAQQAGFIAEEWTAGTFNIDSVAAGTNESANVMGSYDLGSIDVTTSYGEHASLKYYKTGSSSAAAQALKIIEAYKKYCNNTKNPLSFQEYALKNGYGEDVDELWPVYAGQTRIIPKDQLNEAVAYLQGKVNKSDGISDSCKETLEHLKDRLESPKGARSTPATYEEMQAIAEMAKEGKFKAEDFGISTAQIITPKYVLKESMNAGSKTAALKLVLAIGPDIFSIIRESLKTGELDKNKLEKTGAEGLIGSASGFIEGSVSCALLTAFKSGKFGVDFKYISADVVGTLTVIVIDAIKYGYALSKDEISSEEYGYLLSEEVAVAAVARVSGITLQSLLPFLPVAYLAGSMAGGLIASAGVNIAKDTIEKLNINVNAAGGFVALLPEGINKKLQCLTHYLSGIDIMTKVSTCRDIVLNIVEDSYIRLSLNGEYYCPACDAILNQQRGFNLKDDYWVCKKCGQYLFGDDVYSGEKFPNIMWFCDSCNSFLNVQEGFTDTKEIWECTKCGYHNLIVEENILQKAPSA